MIPALGGPRPNFAAVKVFGYGIEGLALSRQVHDLVDSSLLPRVLEELSLVTVEAVGGDADMARAGQRGCLLVVTAGGAESHAAIEECLPDGGLADGKLTGYLPEGEPLFV